MIYLDNAATTVMFEKGVDVYKEYACHAFFNPSASYKPAIDIAKELDRARQTLLNKLGAKTGNIIFTSGATESNNLAIMGSKRNGKWEYIFTVGEHPSVYNTAKELEKQGYKVHFVGLQENGQVDYNKLESLLNERTRLISVIHVSNETGAINDIKKISSLRNKLSKNALLHVDGVQAFCKVELSVQDLGVDFYTMSAHKFHGPKGVGALYVKSINTIKPNVYGGGQEGGYRSGTENVAGIMAMEYAVNNINVKENYTHVQKLKSSLTNLLEKTKGVKCSKFQSEESPYILSVTFEGVNGETLMRALQDYGVIIGTGSACSAKKAGNRILESMGKNKEDVKSHVRISFNEFITEGEIEQCAKIITDVYKNIWEKVK